MNSHVTPAAEATPSKACTCIHDLNERLKVKNLELTGYAFMMPSFSAAVTVNTDWIDRAKAPKGKKTSPPKLTASFCPFCGQAYPQRDAAIA